MNQKDGKILLIRFSSLGDLVLLTALVDAIAKSFPGKELHLVTKERYSDLFEGSDNIDMLHTLPTDAGIAALFGLRCRLAAEGFDIIIDAHNVIRSNLLYHTIRAPRKVQLPKQQLLKLSLIRAGKDLYPESISIKDRYLSLIGELGAQIPSVSTRLDPPREATDAVATLFEDHGLAGQTVIALAPGARWDTKRWPASYFRLLAGELQIHGYGVLIIGGDSELELCRHVAEGTGAVNACGRLSLSETAAALSKASALVTNDSAPLHMSEAVGTPVVALYGPTAKQFGYFPLLPESVALERKLDCRPCSRNGSGPCRIEKRECLERILHSEVLDNVIRMVTIPGENV